MSCDDSPVRFLLVEDDDDHASLTIRAIRKAGVVTQIDRVIDGVEAMHFLLGEEPYADRKLPNLVLLDINMPRKSGLEVLREIRENPGISNLAVVILSTSSEERDISTAYHLKANSYLCKPVNSDEFRAMISELSQYWGVWNEPPPSE